MHRRVVATKNKDLVSIPFNREAILQQETKSKSIRNAMEWKLQTLHEFFWKENRARLWEINLKQRLGNLSMFHENRTEHYIASVYDPQKLRLCRQGNFNCLVASISTLISICTWSFNLCSNIRVSTKQIWQTKVIAFQMIILIFNVILSGALWERKMAAKCSAK